MLAGLTHIVAYQSQPDPNGPISLVAGRSLQGRRLRLCEAARFGQRYHRRHRLVRRQTPMGSSSPASPASPASRSAPRRPLAASALCATTDAAGHYLIEVPAGSYNVAPTNPPAGYTLTTPPAPLPVTVARRRAVPGRRLRLRLGRVAGRHRQPGVPGCQQGRRLQHRRLAAARRQRGPDPRHEREPGLG